MDFRIRLSYNELFGLTELIIGHKRESSASLKKSAQTQKGRNILGNSIEWRFGTRASAESGGQKQHRRRPSPRKRGDASAATPTFFWLEFMLRSLSTHYYEVCGQIVTNRQFGLGLHVLSY